MKIACVLKCYFLYMGNPNINVEVLYFLKNMRYNVISLQAKNTKEMSLLNKSSLNHPGQLGILT